jgi:hypothetical protein
VRPVERRTPARKADTGVLLAMRNVEARVRVHTQHRVESVMCDFAELLLV